MNKQEIIRIKGEKDGWYKEAVFIMNKDIVVPRTYQDLSERADLIIGNHAKKNGLSYERKKERVDQLLTIILVSSLAILVICLYLL